MTVKKITSVESLLEGIEPSRRKFIKRGLLVGGALALSAPSSTVFAQAQDPDTSGKGKGKGRGRGKGQFPGGGKGKGKGRGKGKGKGKGKGNRPPRS